jgi:hypothetical protein
MYTNLGLLGASGAGAVFLFWQAIASNFVPTPFDKGVVKADRTVAFTTPDLIRCVFAP